MALAGLAMKPDGSGGEHTMRWYEDQTAELWHRPVDTRPRRRSSDRPVYTTFDLRKQPAVGYPERPPTISAGTLQSAGR
jgi:hypothetical protein